MKFDDIIAEADFVAWVGAESIGGTPMGQPRLVIGEAKSFGRGDLIKSEDVAQLKKIGSKCPGAMLAVSVLREDFTDNEKRLLRGLVKWGRRLDDKGEHRNPVLLLTATETLDFFVTLKGTWKDKGGEHEKVADYNHTHGLYQIAEATVAIHLGLPTFEEERWRARERRVSSRKAQQAGRDNGEGAVP